MKNLVFFKYPQWPFILTSSLLVVVSLCSCANAKPIVLQPPTEAQEKRYRAWMQEEWISSDSPFLAIEEEVDKVQASGKLLPFYRRAMQQAEKKKDALTLHRAGYSLWQARKELNYPVERKALFDFLGKMDFGPLPKNYRYTRLHFLLKMRDTLNGQLKGVGNRLLQRNPADYEVQFYMAQLFAVSDSKAEREQAVRIVEEMVGKYSAKSGPYIAKSQVYHSLFNRSHKTNDANIAITAYQQALRLTPSNPHNAPYISGAKNMIALLQKEMKR